MRWYGRSVTAFTYSNFSDEAREAVMTAADVALSSGASRVLPEHLEAAIGGAQRSGHPAREIARIPFDTLTVDALSRAHELALAAGEAVDARHLRAALAGGD